VLTYFGVSAELRFEGRYAAQAGQLGDWGVKNVSGLEYEMWFPRPAHNIDIE
jgi:hypothetical protein